MTDLRPIDVSGLAPVAPAPQAVPELRWLPVAALRIDGRYQRPLSDKNWRAIRAIAEGFRWEKFAPILVAPAGEGLWAVIDGQHRCHAAALCGIAEVPALVVAAGVEAQAAAFVAVNGNVVRMSPLNVYRAALAAGETWAEHCHLAVDRAGCVLRTSNQNTSSKKPGEVYCVALIRGLVAAGQSEVVTAGLAAIHALCGGPELYADAVLAPWLRALSDEWRLLPALDLAALLRANRPAKVMARADHDRATQARQGSAEGVRRAVWRDLLRGAAAVSEPAAPVPQPAAEQAAHPVSRTPAAPEPVAVEAPAAPAGTGAAGRAGVSVTVPAAPQPAPVVAGEAFAADPDYAIWLRRMPCPSPWTPALDWALARDVVAGAGLSRVAREARVRMSEAHARWLALTAPLRANGALSPAAEALALSALRARAKAGVAA